jgi:hypothetical protein
MYVVSSFKPEKQSLAGGIFNTVTKICGAVGLGISSSIYSAESTSHAALQTSIRPYSMVFWFCLASSGLGLCFVPFLTIGTQGHSVGPESLVDETVDIVGDKKTGADFQGRKELEGVDTNREIELGEKMMERKLG